MICRSSRPKLLVRLSSSLSRDFPLTEISLSFSHRSLSHRPISFCSHTHASIPGRVLRQSSLPLIRTTRRPFPPLSRLSLDFSHHRLLKKRALISSQAERNDPSSPSSRMTG